MLPMNKSIRFRNCVRISSHKVCDRSNRRVLPRSSIKDEIRSLRADDSDPKTRADESEA